MCACVSLCAHMHRFPEKPEGVCSPEAGVIGSCKVPGVGAGNQIPASTRAVSSLTCWTLSPASIPLLFQVIFLKGVNYFFLFVFIIFILVFNNLFPCFYFYPTDDKSYRSRNVIFMFTTARHTPGPMPSAVSQCLYSVVELLIVDWAKWEDLLTDSSSPI